jgi:hypothetical protein
MVIVVRHIFGFILGILVAPAMLWATGWGVMRATELKNQTGANLFVAIGAMGAAGVVMGVLMVARWSSPLATLLPGLGLVGWTVVYAINPQRAALELPGTAAIQPTMETLLVTGVYGLLGMALMMPTFHPSRWRAKGAADRSGEEFF